MARATLLSLAEQAKVDVMKQLGLTLHEMSRQLTRSRNVIRKYLADPLHYEKKLKESAGRSRKLTSRQERSSVMIWGRFLQWKKARTAIHHHEGEFCHVPSNSPKGRGSVLPQQTPHPHVSTGQRIYPHEHLHEELTVQELKDAIQAEWDALTDAELKNLVASMSSRIVEVIQNNGGETKY
ncbi:Protein CBG02654 [Caenorhabditis briggsae]|uniref:Protein CBG02654 n=1 Tax=Caenorhabditis briggsae TaxID=6238 RepID=A8WTT9_CAEBR|nr:Protein CBG02654 [Caenorhabditis briggsae]CAP23901.1 Protein CBG02654 [Caenorhabditis briggsae]